MTFFNRYLDLVVAIEIGMLLSCLLFMKRMSDETGVKLALCRRSRGASAKSGKKSEKAGKELSVEEAQLLAAAAEDEEAAMKEQARLREIPRELAVCILRDRCSSGVDRISRLETRGGNALVLHACRSAVDSTAMNGRWLPL